PVAERRRLLLFRPGGPSITCSGNRFRFLVGKGGAEGRGCPPPHRPDPLRRCGRAVDHIPDRPGDGWPGFHHLVKNRDVQSTPSCAEAAWRMIPSLKRKSRWAFMLASVMTPSADRAGSRSRRVLARASTSWPVY